MKLPNRIIGHLRRSRSESPNNSSQEDLASGMIVDVRSDKKEKKRRRKNALHSIEKKVEEGKHNGVGEKPINHEPEKSQPTQGKLSKKERWKSRPLGEARTPAGGRRPGTLLLRPDSVLDAAGQHETLLKPQTPMGTSSRLSKTLQEVLHDKDALAYFIQYMGWRDAEHIIKFWLDAASFQASSWTRIRTHSLNHSAGSKKGSPGKDGTGSSTGSSGASSVTSPGHEGNPKEVVDGEGEEGDVLNESGNIRRTGTAEANLNLLSGSIAEAGISSSSGSPTRNDNCDAGKTVIGGVPGESRFAETGAHGTDPLSRGSLQALRDDGASSSRDSGLGSSSPYLETGTAVRSSSPPTKNSNTYSVHSTGVCVTGQTHTTTAPAEEPGREQAAESSIEPSSPTTTDNASHLDTAQETSFQEKLRRSIEKDAVCIYSKYISLDATHPIGITEELRNETISKICREDGQVDPQCFTASQEYIIKLMDRGYFPGFMQSDFHCKHQIDILTGSQVQLADVLYNEAALFYFMENMEQEGAIDLLQCWLAIDNFQQQLSSQHGQYDGLEAQNDAMVIYDKYFSLQATNPLGFDDSVRSEVECNICREGGPLPDCFVTAKRQVLRTIDKVYFPPFLTSDLYFKFLNELINTVHSASDIGGVRQRRRAGSDASSEHSIGSRSTEDAGGSSSTKNTLLAMDTSSMSTKKDIKKALTKINDDMRIDNTHFDPENLWQRPQAGNMTLGRINEVGQFISEFAPNPDVDRKKKANNTSFFKKRKDEKTQEEMALQIAQMIIKDVSMATGCYDDGLDLDMPS